MKIFAWIGSICFAISAIPAAWEALQVGYCTYPWAFLVLWLAGEINLVIYMLWKREWIVALVNYGVNLACLTILIALNTSATPQEDQPKYTHQNTQTQTHKEKCP